jgi:hypothetical protein
MLDVGMPLTGVMIGNGEVEAAAAFASYGGWLFNLGYIDEGTVLLRGLTHRLFSRSSRSSIWFHSCRREASGRVPTPIHVPIPCLFDRFLTGFALYCVATLKGNGLH